MSLAAAPRYAAPFREADNRVGERATGAQSLLHIPPPPPNYPARIAAVVAYLGLLAAFVTVGFKTKEAPIEEQQVVELAPIPAEEQPPEEDAPPPPEAIEMPDVPPPMAVDPIAPVEEVKPVEKPKPEKKIEKRVERTPAPRAAAAKPAPRSAVAAPAVRAPAAPPGASASAIANQFHACMQRAAANAYPESQAPRSAHISYHATFSATGSMTSYTITPSGNGAFDAVANRLGGRCGSVAAPGKPVSLSGAITFSAN